MYLAFWSMRYSFQDRPVSKFGPPYEIAINPLVARRARSAISDCLVEQVITLPVFLQALYFIGFSKVFYRYLTRDIRSLSGWPSGLRRCVQCRSLVLQAWVRIPLLTIFFSFRICILVVYKLLFLLEILFFNTF